MQPGVRQSSELSGVEGTLDEDKLLMDDELWSLGTIRDVLGNECPDAKTKVNTRKDKNLAGSGLVNERSDE